MRRPRRAGERDGVARISEDGPGVGGLGEPEARRVTVRRDDGLVGEDEEDAVAVGVGGLLRCGGARGEQEREGGEENGDEFGHARV